MNSQVTAETISALYQQQSRRVLATLIRLLGDFELAEEALQDAFACALQQWPVDGLPEQPRAWLVSTGRFKAIDKMRQQQTQRKYQQQWRQNKMKTAKLFRPMQQMIKAGRTMSCD
ncbi:sigma factor [Rheinheimera mangrovi]|uniref:sigma factor n=1 Tax=Rheinheimera mangrovi TaxID=2498451 RepID=UPI00197E2205|nr:sigma factor [Rheinheimera mangrovi]